MLPMPIRIQRQAAATRTSGRATGGLKLQMEGCERYESDAVRNSVMLPCENTSPGCLSQSRVLTRLNCWRTDDASLLVILLKLEINEVGL